MPYASSWKTSPHLRKETRTRRPALKAGLCLAGTMSPHVPEVRFLAKVETTNFKKGGPKLAQQLAQSETSTSIDHLKRFAIR